MALSGRIALVTGAGRGLGRVIAVALAREGSHVIAVSRTRDEIDRVVDEIRRAGGAADAVRADVSREEDVAGLASHVASAHGRLHVLVNNAALRMDHIGAGSGGYPYRMPLVDVPVAEWDRLMATNLRGPFLTCKLLAPLLFAAHGASVVNISAGAGVRGQQGRAPYVASKFALEGLTQTLALEWREHDVAVNTLEPGGSVLTDDVKAGLLERGTSYHFLRAEVIAAPAVFLARQDAHGVTGTHVNAVDWCVEHDLGDRERWYVS